MLFVLQVVNTPGEFSAILTTLPGAKNVSVSASFLDHGYTAGVELPTTNILIACAMLLLDERCGIRVAHVMGNENLEGCDEHGPHRDEFLREICHVHSRGRQDCGRKGPQNLLILIPHLIDLVKSLLVEYPGDRQLEQPLPSTDLHPWSLVDTTSNGKMERALSMAHDLLLFVVGGYVDVTHRPSP